MQPMILALMVLLSMAVTVSAETAPEVVFSQDVVAINADGSKHRSLKIDPQTMADMQTYNFDLGRDRLLRIETNIKETERRGINELVATIRRCYRYIETTTGLALDQGILLYLIELDNIPFAYSFRASYNDASQWGEVRLALVERNAPLSGKNAFSALSDLLYDTLPHELGHDVLKGVLQLSHDINGNTPQHTRWFIEGVCEVLAKGFSEREVPSLHRQFLALRNVDTVLSGAQRTSELLSWAQQNTNGLVHESDLYGAAMLTLMIWTESIELTTLLEHISSRKAQVRGPHLVSLLKETTGLDPQEVIQRAHTRGLLLNKKVVLALLEEEIAI